MKVGLILFPVWGAGGLATDVGHYRKILQKAGHTCDFWEIKYSKRWHKKKQPLTYGTGLDGPQVKQGMLSITDDCLKDTIKILNEYDVLVFIHPCPHITDRYKCVENWKELYTETRGRKIVRFTDVFLDKLYPWILDVTDTFEPWSTNLAQNRYVQQFIPECKLSTYPMAFDVTGVSFAKPNDVIWTCAWRGWKGIKQFVKALPDINGSVELYGSGREFRQMRKEGTLPKGRTMHGAVHPKQIITALRRSRISVDLTGFSKKYYGHNNRSFYEPMFFGTVLAAQGVMAEPNGDLPVDCFWHVDKKAIAGSINELINDEKNRYVVCIFKNILHNG